MSRREDRKPAREVALAWRDGREETVAVDDPEHAGGTETVLEAAEAAGVAIPFGCRTGACGTCAGRLVAGAVSHRRPPRALKAGHLRDGYVLCCIACPESDSRIEVGAAVRDDLLAHPFE